MATLEPRSDKVVRDAIDAFLDGRLVPDFVGETVFETKNSRYRLLDGVVFVAPDPSLIGAELVGWLCESPRRCLVESVWQPGSRAVLVDRKQGRNIIVTSTTQLLHQEERGSGAYQGGPAKAHSDFRSWHPPAPNAHGRLPTFSPEILAATPPPLEVAPPPPVPPVTRHSPPPPPLGPAATTSPLPDAKRVHLPPRPIAAQPVVARPLPVPVPPPRLPAASPVPAPPKVPAALDPGAVKEVPRPEPEPAEWALTSAELEMVVEDEPDDGAPFELVEPVNSEPFPLVRR